MLKFLTEMDVTCPPQFLSLPIILSVIPDSNHWLGNRSDNVINLSVRLYVMMLAQRHHARWSNIGVASVDILKLDQRQYPKVESTSDLNVNSTSISRL